MLEIADVFVRNVLALFLSQQSLKGFASGVLVYSHFIIRSIFHFCQSSTPEKMKIKNERSLVRYRLVFGTTLHAAQSFHSRCKTGDYEPCCVS